MLPARPIAIAAALALGGAGGGVGAPKVAATMGARPCRTSRIATDTPGRARWRSTPTMDCSTSALSTSDEVAIVDPARGAAAPARAHARLRFPDAIAALPGGGRARRLPVRRRACAASGAGACAATGG